MIQTPQLLITDDDRDFRETLRSVFEPRGFETRLAADGEEAVQIVREQTVHVVLIDLHMPRLSGLEAIKEIKQLEAELPCILISASVESEGLDAPTYSVLRKPVTRREVTDTVASAMRQCYGWADARNT